MNMSTQLLETLYSVFDMIDAEIPHYTEQWRQSLSTIESKDVLGYLQSVLAPLAGAIQTKNEIEVLRIRPHDNLDALQALQHDTKDAIWGHLNLIVTLCTTMAMLPPEMMGSIDSLATSYASGQVPDVSNLIANIFGQMNATEDTGDTEARGVTTSAQQKLRRLV